MILIDTHVLIWYISSPHKISPTALKKIEEEQQQGNILISCISVWEIYMLVKKERLKLSMDTESWIDHIEHLGFFQFIPIDNQIVGKSVLLPGEFHDDPADRIIVATAREMGIPIITKDTKIQNYQFVETLW